MIIEVTEYNYKGFMLYHVDNQGWKIILDGVAYLFPTAQDAHSAINEFYNSVIPNHKGKKMRTK